VLLLAAALQPQASWVEAKSSHFSISYQPGYENDMEFTRTWLGRAEELLKDKYGAVFTGFFVSLYLYPAPTENANVGLADLHCCSKGANGVRIGTISLLAPSAPVWKDSVGRTSLGLSKDESYHAKLIMSEYITVGHYIVQESRAVAGGWRYYSAPQWFVQGLQEYDGMFHTTDTNRRVTGTALLQWARSHTSMFSCCAAGLVISEPYNGGATFMTFLAAQFGEGIHARLLQDAAPTFEGALENQTKPYRLPELFDRFQAWLSTKAR